MPSELIPLQKAAEILSVSVATLLEWNDHNILKPTITHTGEVGYRQEQINQFLAIRKLSQTPTQPLAISHQPSAISFTPLFAGFLSFSITVVTMIVILKFLPTQPSVTEIALVSPVTDKSNLPTPAEISLSDNTSANANDIIAYTQTTNFSPGKDTPEDSVFDSDGNIKGKATNTGVLAASIFANGIAQTDPLVKQSVNPTILLAFFVFGLLSLPFVFKKPSPTPLPVSTPNTPDQKILELNQKTDGTVVLCFQGQECKVSKPELDSESDQFIERLMGLVAPGVKEIDYDASKDTSIALSTPLSKLVTRLGFVGLKRDLFFPRTSKNRVLFRRYLTNNDLTSMHLSLDQIIPRTTQV
jgi:hypothetical protein